MFSENLLFKNRFVMFVNILSVTKTKNSGGTVMLMFLITADSTSISTFTGSWLKNIPVKLLVGMLTIFLNFGVRPKIQSQD